MDESVHAMRAVALNIGRLFQNLLTVMRLASALHSPRTTFSIWRYVYWLPTTFVVSYYFFNLKIVSGRSMQVIKLMSRTKCAHLLCSLAYIES